MPKFTFPADRKLALMMARLARPVSIAKGTILFSQGDEPRAIYVLRSGQARMTLSGAEGTLMVSILAGPGSILGLPAVFAREPYSMTAELVQDSDLVVIAAGVLLDYTRRHGDFGLRVLRLLGEEVQAARRARVETPRPRRVVRDSVRPR